MLSRAVDRLLHRAQQHGLQQLRIGTRLDLLQQRRHSRPAVGSSPPPRCRPSLLAGKSAAASASPWSGPACTRYSAGCLWRTRKSAAQTLAASMHSSISLCASLRGARHDLLDLARCVADDLGFGGLEIDRAARLRAPSAARGTRRTGCSRCGTQRRAALRLAAVGVAEDAAATSL